MPPGRVGRVTAVCSRRRCCCPLRPFLGWCLPGWVETPVASSQPERREHGCRGVCRWMVCIHVFSNETVFFAPPSSICYHLLPSAAVEPFLARRLLWRFAMLAWQRAAVTRCLAGEWEMRRGGGAKEAKGGRKGRCFGVGGSALRGAKERPRSKAAGWQQSRKRAWKRQMPGGFPLGIACQLWGRKIRSRSQGSPEAPGRGENAAQTVRNTIKINRQDAKNAKEKRERKELAGSL